MLHSYWTLLKPGIVRGNLLVALAGYLLAARGDLNFFNLIVSVSGIALIIASACVWNNIIDAKIDSSMSRTKNRPIVTNKISKKNAYIFSIILGIFGAFLLIIFTNILTLALGVISWLWYVYFYAYAKRNTNYGTIVGAVPGAMPPVAGYTAISGTLDSTALMLFLILFWWQLPHFWSISIFRMSEYQKAKIPTLPSKLGLETTKKLVLFSIVPFILSIYSLYVVANLSLFFILMMITVSLYWLGYGLLSLNNIPDMWAKAMFGISLLVLLVFCINIFIEFLLS